MSHLKRLCMPKSWPIKRKGIKFAIKPKPGPHPLESSMPLGMILRDVLKYAANTREVKFILQNKIILVDGKRRKDHRFPVGLFDVIKIADTEEAFRVVFNKKGDIELIQDKAADTKLCRIAGKGKVKGKTHLRLHDGKNILVDKDDYKVGDGLFVSLPKLEIKEHIKFEKGTLVYLIGGKHTGETGKVEDVAADKVIYKNDKNILVETLKGYTFPVGKTASLIKLKK